jgi:hypothetical protein
MSTLKLKNELQVMIKEGDENFIKFFFDMAKAYKSQLVKDKMIEEGEEDIENGRLFSLEEAKEIVLKWKKE